MTAAHRRHDISDEVWTVLEPHLPGRRGAWGGKAKDNGQFINAVFRILRPGAICPRTMTTGKIRTVGSAAGLMRAPGGRCWSC